MAALLAGGAPIDAFGVGTAISAVSDAPALGGIYKLVETIHEGRAVPTVKLSSGKQTYPGRKQVWRMGSHGMAERDVVGLESESPIEGRPLLSCVMRQGKRVQPSASVREMARRARARLAEMPAGVARIDGVAEYPISISEALDRLVRETVRAHM